MGQRAYCTADHSASKSDQDADRWCEMYHHVEMPKATRPPATYRKHMTTTDPAVGSNFRITCVCGWSVRLASLSDLAAAEAALLHVRTAQPESIEALFDRL